MTRLEAAAAAYRAAVMELRAVNEAHATRRGYSWARHEAAVRPPRLCPYPRCGHTGPLERKAR